MILKKLTSMFNGLLDKIKNNKASSGFIAAALLVVLLSLAMQGCMLADVIKHGVPSGMQSLNEDKPKVSLRSSVYLRERYIDDVERNLRQYDESAADSFMLMDIISSGLTLGINAVGQSPFPGAAVLSTGLLGLAGLFTRKPGTDKMVQDEKIKSHNRADMQWRETLTAILTPELMAQAVAMIESKKGDKA